MKLEDGCMKATKLHIPYTSQMFEEDGQIVALCPELNVSSFGDTREDALAALQEAVTLFLEECQIMGTLDVVLEEAGYRRERHGWSQVALQRASPDQSP